MGHLSRFLVLSSERKLLVIFAGLCAALPFAMARSPLEVASHSFPMWIYFQGAVGYWFASGKPLWQASLACYGISTFELLGLYFGTFGVRLLFQKAISWFNKPLEKKNSGYRRFNSYTENKKRQFAGWLGRQSTWIILIFLFLPLPITDILAAITLGARGLKYGHWYLAAVNLPHIFLVVYLLKLGVTFLFL